jgi:hypothetical protein
MIDRRGTTETSLRHRLHMGWKHWFARSKQLCYRRAPLKDRVLRFFNTVVRTVLWGAGEWCLDSRQLAELDSFAFKCLTRIWNRRRASTETPWDFQTRMNAKIRKWLREWQQPLPSSLALKLYHGWAGHICRLSDPNPIASLLKWRDASWQQLENQKNWKHRVQRASRGNLTRWESCLLKCHGEAWMEMAQNRSQWRSLGVAFVTDRLWTLPPDFTHSPWGRDVPMVAYKAVFHNVFGLSPQARYASGTKAVLLTSSMEVAEAARDGRDSCIPKTLLARLLQAVFVAQDMLHLRPAGHKLLEHSEGGELEAVESMAKAACYFDFADETCAHECGGADTTLLGVCKGICVAERSACAMMWYSFNSRGPKLIYSAVRSFAGASSVLEVESLAVVWAVKGLVQCTVAGAGC